MTRLNIRKEHLPGLASLVAPLLVLLCLWAVPAWAFPAEEREERVGEPVEVRWSMKTVRHQTFSWRETVMLPEDGPGLVKPSLPYKMDFSGMEGGGFDLAVRTFVNGEELGHFTLQTLARGRISSLVGYPDYLYGVPREAFRPGANEVLVVADVTVVEASDGVAVVTLGPPLLTFVPDADGDRVADAHQPTPRIPTDILASALAVPACPLAYFVVRRLVPSPAP